MSKSLAEMSGMVAGKAGLTVLSSTFVMYSQMDRTIRANRLGSDSESLIALSMGMAMLTRLGVILPGDGETDIDKYYFVVETNATPDKLVATGGKAGVFFTPSPMVDKNGDYRSEHWPIADSKVGMRALASKDFPANVKFRGIPANFPVSFTQYNMDNAVFWCIVLGGMEQHCQQSESNIANFLCMVRSGVSARDALTHVPGLVRYLGSSLQDTRGSQMMKELAKKYEIVRYRTSASSCYSLIKMMLDELPNEGKSFFSKDDFDAMALIRDEFWDLSKTRLLSQKILAYTMCYLRAVKHDVGIQKNGQQWYMGEKALGSYPITSSNRITAIFQALEEKKFNAKKLAAITGTQDLLGLLSLEKDLDEVYDAGKAKRITDAIADSKEEAELNLAVKGATLPSRVAMIEDAAKIEIAEVNSKISVREAKLKLEEMERKAREAERAAANVSP